MTSLGKVTDLDIDALCDALARGAVSAEDVARAYIERVARFGGDLAAFVSFEPDAILADARAKDAAFDATGPMGALHGLPVAVKDVIDVAGTNTTACSALLEDNRAQDDADVVARLRAAGAVIFGKTTTHEFAIGGPSFDLPWPPARNPWNPDCHPGASSSGSGAGLGARLFPAALGTDTGGSVRNPATSCGIVGLKPTRGAVSTRGVVPLSPSFDCVGPMATTVAGCARLGASLQPGLENWRDIAVRDRKVGLVRRWHRSDHDAAPAMEAAFEAAADALAAAGAKLVDIDPGSLGEYSATAHVIRMSEAYAIHRRDMAEQPEKYGALTLQRIAAGAYYSAADLIDALSHAATLRSRWDASAEDCDVVLTLSSFDLPCRLEDLETFERNYARQARAPFNMTGHPALAVPTGLSADGLPTGVQLVGPHGGEATCLAYGAVIEAALTPEPVFPPGCGLPSHSERSTLHA